VIEPNATLANVLVVLPCLNEAQSLPGILDDLLGDTVATGLLIIVADGGSTDGTVDLVNDVSARDSRVMLLANPKRRQSAGVNLAVQRFGGERDWLVRMDCHAAYPRRFVRRLVEAAQAVGSQSVVVPMITQGRSCFQRAVAAAQNSPLGTGGSAHRRLSAGGWVDHGHHALFELAGFRQLGCYDEAFVANEDAELDVRLARAGGRIWLADDLAITYYPRASVRTLFRQYLRYGAGRAQTLLRHRVRPKVRQILPLLVAPAVLLAPTGVLYPPLALPAGAWAAVCILYGAALGARERDACAAASGLAAMTMHLAWSLGFFARCLSEPNRRGRRAAADAAQ
jgi:succinoglycan biosynthesis protein ExoA